MLNATLVDRIEVTPELLRLFVRADVTPKPFLAGQYVALGLPGSAARMAGLPPEVNTPVPDKLIKRAYSIGSSPDRPEILEFYIAVLPQGALTARLGALRPGDRLFMATKITGTFTLEGVPEDRNLIFVATGTGIAPFISMLLARGTLSDRRIVRVLHGVRLFRDLGYRDELHAMIMGGAQIEYYPVVSREDPPPGQTALRGHVQKIFEGIGARSAGESGKLQLNPQSDHIFLCGNPAMIDDMEKMALALGFNEHSKRTPGNLHLERYW